MIWSPEGVVMGLGAFWASEVSDMRAGPMMARAKAVSAPSKNRIDETP
jgi:hypothetical protein